MPPARRKTTMATACARKATKAAIEVDSFVLPPHVVRTTFTMPGRLWEVDIFHHVQQYCFSHHPGAHVEATHHFPRSVEFHVTAWRSDELISAVCANIANVLGRPIRYRVGDMSAILKPKEVTNHTPLSVNVVQRVTGSPELHRRACFCHECCSSSSSGGSGNKSASDGEKGNTNGDDKADGSGVYSSPNFGRPRKRRRRSYFPFGGQVSLQLGQMHSSTHKPSAPARASSSLSPTPVELRTPASATTPTISPPPPFVYLAPGLPREPSTPTHQRKG
ncbi:hypothetical protein CspHIS471_0309940 [Cutaneotrichosporon sp. HIS471]|nr:hypothetical protein CspHIS471_0309940 [Cutaneotrichosporon sp. HIS471]